MLYTANLVHIVLLGDSTTELTCWRAMVWDMLVKENLRYEVLFVGSKTNNAQNCRARSGTFDLHCIMRVMMAYIQSTLQIII